MKNTRITFTLLKAQNLRFNTFNLSFYALFSPSLVSAILLLWPISLRAQEPLAPIPVEFFAGHQKLYYQMVMKRPLIPKKRLEIFALATYSATYDRQVDDNRLIAITQLSYQLGKGFGAMVGTDINSFSGFSPVVGPRHSFATKDILAVTVLSYFVNGVSDLKLFGMYEYKPKINERWTFYSRAQFIYNYGIEASEHNVSYIYLRAGLKRNAFIFGLGTNLDWAGPSKAFSQNHGAFVRWEFR